MRVPWKTDLALGEDVKARQKLNEGDVQGAMLEPLDATSSENAIDRQSLQGRLRLVEQELEVYEGFSHHPVNALLMFGGRPVRDHHTIRADFGLNQWNFTGWWPAAGGSGSTGMSRRGCAARLSPVPARGSAGRLQETTRRPFGESGRGRSTARTTASRARAQSTSVMYRYQPCAQRHGPALLLSDDGIRMAQLATDFGCCQATGRRWLHQFAAVGLEFPHYQRQNLGPNAVFPNLLLEYGSSNAIILPYG